MPFPVHYLKPFWFSKVFGIGLVSVTPLRSSLLPPQTSSFLPGFAPGLSCNSARRVEGSHLPETSSSQDPLGLAFAHRLGNNLNSWPSWPSYSPLALCHFSPFWPAAPLVASESMNPRKGLPSGLSPATEPTVTGLGYDFG